MDILLRGRPYSGRLGRICHAWAASLVSSNPVADFVTVVLVAASANVVGMTGVGIASD